MSLAVKLTSLAVRTAAKPISNWIKSQAREHDTFRRTCVRFAQGLHFIDVRMRLGLLNDPEAIQRQVEREAAEAEEKRLRAQHRPSSQTPTAKTQAETEGDEKARKQERSFIEGKVKKEEKRRNQRLHRPLSETKAIETGANFIAEGFLFAVAAGLLISETQRNKSKESKRRDEVKDRLEVLETEIKTSQEENVTLRDQVSIFEYEIERLKGQIGEQNHTSRSEQAEQATKEAVIKA